MADQRPNIILIITDQQRYDTIAALGFPHMDTPNLDRLANEGVSFSNCFVTAPSCVPSRASLFNGFFPHTTGVFCNADRWSRSWVDSLAESGYYCVNIGKMHTVPYDAKTGFHQRYVVENKDRYLDGRYFFDEWDKALAAKGLVKQQRVLYRDWEDYSDRLGAFEWKLPPEMHSDFFVGDTALWWLERHPRTEPLFLEIGFPGPHPPYDPVPRYAEPYLNRELPIAEAGPEEIAGQPPPLRNMIQHNREVDHDSVVHKYPADTEARRRQRAYYLANVTMIDEKIGQIIDRLEAMGYLDDAVVMFTSDHGDCLGDHGHSQKWTMYDTTTRVPSIVWSPDRFGGGRRETGLCQNMDLGPTILELAGLPVPPEMEAVSLMGALETPGSPRREYVFSEHGPDNILQGVELMTMVRNEGWKLVSFHGEDYGQLYDLQQDPHELVNRWDDPVCSEQKAELLEAHRSLLVESSRRTGPWKSSFR